jgi:hypothetical protein
VEGDDVAEGAVYRDAEGDVPLSRRPKEVLEFREGNVVVKLATGPDDRAHEVARTTWTDVGGHVVFHFDAADARGATTYEIVERSPDRLVIERR